MFLALLEQEYGYDFVFLGSTSSQFRQIGNAVAVDFAYHLGKTLKDFEEKKLKPQDQTTIEFTNHH